jgi:hypothetical protein
MRQFQDHSEMHAMRSEIMKTLEKVKTMPPGTAEKSVALDMLAVRNRHLIELELKKKIALARNPGRQAAYRATLSQTRERWRREDAISAAELRERQDKFSSHWRRSYETGGIKSSAWIISVRWASEQDRILWGAEGTVFEGLPLPLPKSVGKNGKRGEPSSGPVA